MVQSTAAAVTRLSLEVRHRCCSKERLQISPSRLKNTAVTDQCSRAITDSRPRVALHFTTLLIEIPASMSV